DPEASDAAGRAGQSPLSVLVWRDAPGLRSVPSRPEPAECRMPHRQESAVSPSRLPSSRRLARQRAQPAILAILGLLLAGAPVAAQHTLLFDSETGPAVLPGNFPAHYGKSAAQLGDLDGDGVRDYAVGAPGLFGAVPGKLVIHSGADGRLLDVVHNFEPDMWRLGEAVCGLDDVGGDGVDDLAVGAPGYLYCGPYGPCIGDRRGRVRVLSGADRSLITEWSGLTDQDLLGTRLARAGDLDFDGLVDLAVAMPGAGGTGEVRVVSPSSGIELLTLVGSVPGCNFGADLRTLPDNPPGAVRFAVTEGGVGCALLVSLFDDAGGLLAVHDIQDIGGIGLGAIGIDAIAIGGDVDGDGIGDLALLVNRPGQLKHLVQFVSGANGQQLHFVKIEETFKAYSAALVADRDGDGLADVAFNDRNVVTYVSSASGASLLVVPFDQGHIMLGGVMRRFDDLNGDGADELLVTAWNHSPGGGHVTKTYGPQVALIYSGVDIPILPKSAGGLGGTFGVPAISVTGGTSPGDTLQVDVDGALPGSTLFLVVGDVVFDYAVKGGLMVPRADVLLLGRTDGSGHWSHNAIWQPGIQFGELLHLQAWIVDAAGPVGWSASDAVQLTVQ
ncbi:MAG: hypothetical protein ACI9EF_003365, partial [Pseudohongiellaceae bacterium]